MTIYKLGTELSPIVQREALARFIHRFTRDHKPSWVRSEAKYLYPVQFASDAEWLANTRFAVTVSGELDKRVSYCESSPTWPDGNVLKSRVYTNEERAKQKG